MSIVVLNLQGEISKRMEMLSPPLGSLPAGGQGGIFTACCEVPQLKRLQDTSA